MIVLAAALLIGLAAWAWRSRNPGAGSGDLPARTAQSHPIPIAANGPAATPQIEASERELDLGRVPVGKVMVHEFRFDNRGDAALEIASVGVGCGCTVVGDWTRRVEPGGSGGVIMTFTVPETDGVFHKTLNVASNDPAHPQTVFAVKGEAWKLFEADPARVVFDRVEGEPPGNPVKVRLVNRSGKPIELSGARGSLPGVEVRLAEKTKGLEYEVLVEPQEGTFSTGGGQIMIGCAMKDVPQITVPLVVNAVPALSISPAEVVLAANPTTSAEIFRLALRSASATPLAVPELISAPDGITVAMTEVEAGKIFGVAVSVPTGWKLPEGRAAVVALKTAHPNFPRLEIPLLRRDAGDRTAFRELPSGKASAAGVPDFATKSHDFGSVPAGAVIGHDFSFAVPNGGPSVEIVRVDSCSNKGVVRDWSRTVAPGQTGNVSLALNTAGLDGPVEIAFLIIAGNDPTPAAELRLKALIRQSQVMDKPTATGIVK